MWRIWILCLLLVSVATAVVIDYPPARSDSTGREPQGQVVFASADRIADVAWRRTERTKRKTSRPQKKAVDRMLFGDRKVEPRSDSKPAGMADSFPFIDPVSGTAHSVNVYLGRHSHVRRLLAGLYSNRNGRPGSLLAWGSRSSPRPGAWNTVKLPSRSVHAGRVYWITFMAKGGRMSLRVRSGGCHSIALSRRPQPGLPASWNRGHVSASCPVSAFISGTLARGGASGGSSQGSGNAPSGTSPAPGTPAQPPAACTSTPHTPDGPDPWGGCFPGPRSTGVPAGTQLTPYTGSCTVNTANLVIDAKTINCSPLTIRASNVEITRSLVNGEVSIDSYPSSYSFTISDSEVIADSTATGVNNGATGIGNSNFVALRDNVHGGIRSIWCEFNCTEKDNWLHGQLTDPTGAAHESATRMGENSIITHNSMVCDAPNVPPDAGCSADLTGYGDFEVIESNTISNNLFLATEGGTCAYGGSTPGKPYSNGVHNIVFQNNIFQRGPGNTGAGKLGHCGNWFGISDFDASAPGNQWVNNRWDDGTLMPSDG